MAQMATPKGTKSNWIVHRPIPCHVKFGLNADQSDDFKNSRKLFDKHYCIVLELGNKSMVNGNDNLQFNPEIVSQLISFGYGTREQCISASKSVVNYNDINQIIDKLNAIKTKNDQKINDINNNDDNINSVTPGMNHININNAQIDPHTTQVTPEGIPQTDVINQPQIQFYQYLNKTLTKLGCKDKDLKEFFIKGHKHITSNMIERITKITTQKSYVSYKLLSKVIKISSHNNYHFDDHDNKNNDDLKNNDTDLLKCIQNANFTLKLNYSHKKWMKDNAFHCNLLRNELSSLLKVSSVFIKFSNDVKKGSVIIDFLMLNVWIPFYVARLQSDHMKIPYNMRPQDQIEVKYSTKWYAATIMDIRNFVDQQGINFKIHYNKIKGNDAFIFKNTEWFYSKTQGNRLRFPNQIYISFTAMGVQIRSTFIPPCLAQINNIKEVQCGHHIYVKRKNMWHRCEVIEIHNLFEGIKIKVTYLDYIFWNNDEWLELFNPLHLAKISLNDERCYI